MKRRKSEAGEVRDSMADVRRTEKEGGVEARLDVVTHLWPI